MPFPLKENLETRSSVLTQIYFAPLTYELLNYAKNLAEVS